MCSGHGHELAVVRVEARKVGVVGEFLEGPRFRRCDADLGATVRVCTVRENPFQEGVADARLPRRPQVARILRQDQPGIVEDDASIAGDALQSRDAGPDALREPAVTVVRNDGDVGIDDNRPS
jgi:hypothetical protein